MHAEIITIGNEILLGEIIDTNSRTIAKKLQTIGLPLYYTATVGDDLNRMAESIKQGMARSEVVITTGGLGPTVDDLTREAMALATGRDLVFDEGLLAQIEERFRRWNRPMTENNRKQAYRPEGSLAIENPVGTAPCFAIERGGRIAISLPGVPREMEYLMDHSVLPLLRQRFNLTGIIKSRELKVSGAGESQVDMLVGDLETLSNPTVGLNAHSGVIVIRITASADSEAEADKLIAPVESIARQRLGKLIFGADADTLEAVVLAELDSRGETLAVVECGTGGRLAGKLAQSAHGVNAFAGGKLTHLCGLHGPTEMARQAATEAQTHWGLACVLKDEGGVLQLGIGLWNFNHQEAWQRGFGGHAALAPEWSANLALDALRKVLSAEFK